VAADAIAGKQRIARHEHKKRRSDAAFFFRPKLT
jgi:hypothetical protein